MAKVLMKGNEAIGEAAVQARSPAVVDQFRFGFHALHPVVQVLLVCFHSNQYYYHLDPSMLLNK